MTDTIDRIAGTMSAPARRLQSTFAAVRLSFTWFGVRRTLTRDQKQEAAEGFGAEGDYLSAAKKLLDTKHPAFKAVTSLRNRAVACWRGQSLPYPEPGIRLIRQNRIELFDRQMHEIKDELAEAVEQLDQQYAELKAAAQQRLGRLYNSADYPPSLHNLFAMEWDFPSVAPPDYLRQLNPELFEQEQARIAARFDEAVKLAEEAFTAEFAKVVSHLTDRLSGTEEGKAKVFRDSAVTNLADFFQRFRSLNVHSNAELDRLVETAQRAVQGIEPQAIRVNTTLRQTVATQLSAVQATLDQMLVDKPRRRILRSMQQQGGS